MNEELLKNSILVIICVLFAFSIWTIVKNFKKDNFKKDKFYKGAIICFITDFLDNIGIGCFAPQTFLMEKLNLTVIKKIPGTLNVAYLGAAVAESFLSLKIIQVDFTTFIVNVVLASLGSFIGAKFLHKLDEEYVKRVIGIGLLIAAVTIALKMFNVLPSTGTLEKLTGGYLVISAIASLLIGIGISFGIGNFAPTLAVFMFLGFSTKAVFPIMMVSAFTTSYTGSLTFIKNKDYEESYAIAGLIFGTIGVILSALIIFNLPEYVFKWITLVVVIVASLSILTSKRKNTK